MASTTRGHIEQLPSGSFRVHVYAGTDPVTASPGALSRPARRGLRRRGTRQAARPGRRRPLPNREATLGQALAKYLEVADLEISTREAHEGYVRRADQAAQRIAVQKAERQANSQYAARMELEAGCPQEPTLG